MVRERCLTCWRWEGLCSSAREEAARVRENMAVDDTRGYGWAVADSQCVIMLLVEHKGRAEAEGACQARTSCSKEARNKVGEVAAAAALDALLGHVSWHVVM